MKKIIRLFIYFFFLNGSFSFGQNVSKVFLDGEVYVKIKNEIPFVFDTLHQNVEISSKLKFLIPLINKYNITKTEASFYFSRSDRLRRIFRIHFNKIELIDKLIAELKRINQIEYVEKIPIMRIVYAPNDLLPNQDMGQYALYNIHAQDAWDVTRGNSSVLVAIVDNAIDVNHTDLSANVKSQWDVSDDDGNAAPPNSSWEHGTHTSGIACASTDNGKGIASIGFFCGLMAVKATSDNGNSGNIDDGYEGISWAVENGAKVISCSWGNYESSSAGQDVIDDAYDNNAIVVAAAGNDHISTPFYPAAYNHVVAVAAVDINDTKASFSNYGNWVDVSAPGVDIYSTLPGNSYGLLSGTSMAAPMVAGLCGLIRSLNPALSYDAVVSDLVNSTDNINAQNPGYNGKLGSGRINAYRAVESALTCNPSINLGNGVYKTLKTESSGTITSSNIIPVNTQVTLDAASAVRLLPGFFAINGSAFRAHIDGCGGGFAPANYQKISAENSLNTEQVKVKYHESVTTLYVYPNPASSSVNLDFNLEHNEKNLMVDVYGMNSKRIKRISLGNATPGNHTSTLNLNDLSSGIYMVVLQLSSSQLTAKVVLIK